MKVVICNFGLENWAWPECLKNSTIAVMDDIRVHPFYVAGDRDGYIAAAKKFLHAPGQDPVGTAVASRWFNLTTILLETDGDLWIHRDGDRLWWTISSASKPTQTEVVEPKPRFGGQITAVLYQKPCPPWSDKTKQGATLSWAALHPKAQNFLVTRASFASLTDDNALYAKQLIEGGDLSAWHARPAWKNEQAKAKQKTGKTYNSLEKTAVRIAMSVMQTVASSGSLSIAEKKDKQFGFLSQAEFEKYILELMQTNQMLCALTGIEMQADGEVSDDALCVSPDRIDSNGHYERGNIQLVCKFVNRWKGAQPDEEFRRLLGLVRDIE